MDQPESGIATGTIIKHTPAGADDTTRSSCPYPFLDLGGPPSPEHTVGRHLAHVSLRVEVESLTDRVVEQPIPGHVDGHAVLALILVVGLARGPQVRADRLPGGVPEVAGSRQQGDAPNPEVDTPFAITDCRQENNIGVTGKTETTNRVN